MTSDDAQYRTRVLVVDDHDLVAHTLRRALGFESDLVVVGLAGSVASAVLAAADLRPDVIVMDFRLPDGTGVDATALIKANCAETEIVMLTGQATSAMLAEALAAGCSGFVAKEGRFDELVETIRAVVRGEVRVPPALIENIAPYLRPRPASLGSDLTSREREVLTLLATGRSTNQMVDEMFLSIHTVRNHVRNILAKLQSNTRLEAVTVAMRLGIVSSVANSTRLGTG